MASPSPKRLKGAFNPNTAPSQPTAFVHRPFSVDAAPYLQRRANMSPPATAAMPSKRPPMMYGELGCTGLRRRVGTQLCDKYNATQPDLNRRPLLRTMDKRADAQLFCLQHFVTSRQDKSTSIPHTRKRENIGNRLIRPLAMVFRSRNGETLCRTCCSMPRGSCNELQPCPNIICLVFVFVLFRPFCASNRIPGTTGFCASERGGHKVDRV